MVARFKNSNNFTRLNLFQIIHNNSEMLLTWLKLPLHTHLEAAHILLKSPSDLSWQHFQKYLIKIL